MAKQSSERRAAIINKYLEAAHRKLRESYSCECFVNTNYNSPWDK